MMIRKANNQAHARRGFTLVELAIVLAVTSLLFAGLWRLMASGNTQLRDQAAADQHRQLIAAVASFLDSNEGQIWVRTIAENGTAALGLPANNANLATCQASYAATLVLQPFCDYLPPGFASGTRNSYGQTFSIRVRRIDDVTAHVLKGHSFMIGTVGGDQIPDSSGGRIASMIGNDGGFVYADTNVCGAGRVCGAFGSWSATPADYGLAVATGRIASRSQSGTNAAQVPWLARHNVPNDTDMDGIGDYNTVQTDISLGGKTLYGKGTAAPPFKGAIIGLRYVEIGRDTDKNDISGGLSENTPLIVGGCSIQSGDPVGTYKPGPEEAGYDTNGCDYSLQVNGHQNVTGLLQATKLYSRTFFYDSNSDRRLKEEIFPVENALEKMGELRGYRFKMKDSGEVKYGVIAQEVEKVFPEIVHEAAGGYKMVDYMGLIGPMIEAIVELKKENESLKAEIGKLSAPKGRKKK